MDVGLLPYHFASRPFECVESSAGYCLPDLAEPYLIYPPELSVTGARARPCDPRPDRRLPGNPRRMSAAPWCARPGQSDMLFLLKLNPAAAAGLILLAAYLRDVLPDVPPIDPSIRNVLLGVAVVAAVLGSDVTIHGLSCLVFGEGYRRRHRELAATSSAAQPAGGDPDGGGDGGAGRGAAFSRGQCRRPVSGCVGRRLRPAAASRPAGAVRAASSPSGRSGRASSSRRPGIFRDLSVTMTAHFLHDFSGFLIFRRLTRRGLPINGDTPEVVRGCRVRVQVPAAQAG